MSKRQQASELQQLRRQLDEAINTKNFALTLVKMLDKAIGNANQELFRLRQTERQYKRVIDAAMNGTSEEGYRPARYILRHPQKGTL